MAMITQEQKIYFAKQKAKQELKENNISFKDGFSELLDFTIDDETYSYNPHNNRVYSGVYSSQLTLKKFIKAMNQKKSIEWI